MKKILFLLVSIIFWIFFFINFTNANRYYSHSVNYTSSDQANCWPWDWDITWWIWDIVHNIDYAVTNISTNLIPTPSINSFSANSNQTNAISVWTSWIMYCLYYDASAPTWWTLTYMDWWTNSNQTITYWNFNDAWWSKLSFIKLWQNTASIDNNWNILSWNGWTIVDQVSSINSNSYWNKSFTTNFSNKTAYQYKIEAQDNAGNDYFVSWTNTIKYETDIPTWNFTNYNNWRTNNTNQTISFDLSDLWWSHLSSYLLQEAVATDSPNFVTWWPWNTVQTENTINSNPYSTSYNFTADNGKAYKFQVVVYDNAWNINTIVSPSNNIIQIDTIPPALSDINSLSPANNTNLLATDLQNFSFNVSANWWAPINYIWAYFEDFNSNNNFKSIETSGSWDWLNTESIQDVDSYNQRMSWTWARLYSLRVSKICDQAWNCTFADLGWTTYNCNPTDPIDANSNIVTYNYNVYANTTLMTWWNSSKNITTNELDQINNNVADWTTKNLSITLKDAYWNAIVPASWIWRTIDFNFNDVNNIMYLNQYNTLSSTTSVFLDRPNDSWNYINRFSIWDTILKPFDWETSSNWVYTYWFKFYTPTSNSYSPWVNWPVSDPNAKFSINGITFDVNWSLWNLSAQTITNSSNIIAQYSPLYYTTISWDIKEDWLIEWNVQNTTLNITSNNSWVSPTSWTQKTYLSFSWAATSKYNLKFSNDWSNPTNNISISPILSTDFWNIGWTLKTFLSLKNPPAPTTIKAYLSTHIAYNMPNPSWSWPDINVVYNSDIIWRDSYFWITNTLQTANQSWLKIIWNVTSKSATGVLDNQLGNDIKIVWNSDKFISKTQIIKNWYSFAKNATWYTWNGILTEISDTPNFWESVNNIIYLWATTWNTANKTYQLWNWTINSLDDIEINTKKTILVIWWNLYIKSNMYYTWNWMLGIVVLKDKNWNGWNIYIDPSVTNIVWSLFAEKSLISYNWVELDWNTLQSTLKNQLHIYWNVFSENTIGWSAKTIPECPYYITSCSSKELAQKYDLNYLRRYYLIEVYEWVTIYKKPANNWRVIWWWIYDSNWNITWNSTNPYARKITTTNITIEPYAQNSVVIEYNPKVQSNTPPIFKASK